MKRHASNATANPPLEKMVQQQITRLFAAAGGIVRSTSQTRASRVAVGIPDLMIHFPGSGFVFFECKTYRRPWRPMDPPATWRPNPLSPDQVAFRDDCLAAGVRHAWGGLPQAEDLLVELGLAERRKDGHLIVRKRSSMYTLAPIDA